MGKAAYITAIHASSKLGKGARALRYLKDMNSNGTKKDVIAISAAISACATKGQWSEVWTAATVALYVLKIMRMIIVK